MITALKEKMSLEEKIHTIRADPQLRGIQAEAQVELAVKEHLDTYPHHRHIIEGSLPSLEEQAKNFWAEKFGKKDESGKVKRDENGNSCYKLNLLPKPIFLKRLYGGPVSKDIASLIEFSDVKKAPLKDKLFEYEVMGSVFSILGTIWQAWPGGLDFKTALFAASGYVIQDLLTLQEPAPYYYTSYLETAKKADMLLKEEVKPYMNLSTMPYR